ncbi:MAG: hypothetical protein ACC628_28260 [Pirellulaceae bacterium]
MVYTIALLAVTATAASQPDALEGTLSGIVVNMSNDSLPAGGTEIILRARMEGSLVPVAQTVADAQGRFRFEHLPIGGDSLYLAGANSDGVHYPGPRVQLTQQRPEVAVKLEVYDAVSEPSPLKITRYEIVIHPKPGALNVTESMIVENSSTTSYVGRPAHKGGSPVTLRLAIPPDFDRTTFNKEFFGRRFLWIKEKLTTGVPWPPGKRELKFSYVLANDSSHRIWRRPLDLPCRSIRLIVETDNPEEVSCSLGPAERVENGRVIFQSTATTLPPGQVIQLELGLLPVRWITYGRWIALLALGMVISAASLATLRRRNR